MSTSALSVATNPKAIVYCAYCSTDSQRSSSSPDRNMSTCASACTDSSPPTRRPMRIPPAKREPELIALENRCIRGTARLLVL